MDPKALVSGPVADAVAALDPRISVITAEVVAHILDQNPRLRLDLDLVTLLTASVEANVTTAVHVIGHGIPIDRVEAPPAAVEYARRLAQRDVPIRLLIRAYRLGQAVFIRWCYEELVAHVTDRETALAAGQELNESAFSYIDQVTEYVVATYTREREQWLRHAGAVRADQVRSLLEGGKVDIRAAEAVLGYRLDTTHLGLIAWATSADAPGGEGTALARIELLARRLAERLPARGAPLVIPQDDSSAWVWIPLPPGQAAAAAGLDAAGLDAAGLDARLDAAGLEAALDAALDGREYGIRLAVGEPAAGLEGFRRTIRQARQARTVAVAAASAGRPVTVFGGIAPVALMAENLSGTREWVQRTLGPLAIGDEHHARLRETLHEFLTTNGSYIETARRLTLHKNTVLYRVRKAEESRGRPVGDDRMEVELALFTCHWLGPSVLAEAPAKPPH